MDYLVLKKSNCRNCHKCIRHCPVKSIRFSGNQAYINQDECVLCGTCFVVCPQNAKQIVDERERVKALLAGPDPVYASVAPSFIANYAGCGIEAVEEALKKLGFAGAEETAVGATIVKREYDRMLETDQRDVIITSCCNSINLLIQKYYPSLLGSLADVLSPMQAHCKLLKEQHPGAKTVFFGPCVAKMEEADHYPGMVDAVMNFDQLTAWLKDEGIAIRQEIIPNRESKARFFPTPGGVLKTMELKNHDYTYVAIDGIENCIMALDDIRNSRIHHCFIEMNACTGSCVGGPIMEKYKRTPIQDAIAISSYAGDQDFPVEQPVSQEVRKHFDVLQPRNTMPSEQQITEVLHMMGKKTAKDELNCGSCGYNSCRDKAIAVCQGKAEISMCLPYLMSRTESFSGTVLKNIPAGVLVINEDLELQDINPAAIKMLSIDNPADYLGADAGKLLDTADLVDVLLTGRGIKEKHERLENFRKDVAKTIVYNREYHILITILRDITAETESHNQHKAHNEQTAKVADQVIQHQMRIVQEIACLLGETAAETKVALTKLKESIQDE